MCVAIADLHLCSERQMFHPMNFSCVVFLKVPLQKNLFKKSPENISCSVSFSLQ